MSRLARARRLTVRLLIGMLAVLIVYPLLALVLGLIPVNRHFRPATDGIDIFLVSGGTHSGLALPRVAAGIDWRRELPPEPSRQTVAAGGASTIAPEYVVIGWGDRAVYAEIGGWGNLRPGHVLSAMVGINHSVLRAEYVPQPAPGRKAVRVRVSADAYRRLAQYVRATVLRDADGRPRVVTGRGRHANDAFYEAHGSYSVFYTCNEWTRIGLARAGIRTALWSPFDRALFHHLPPPG